ncbi:hypothetical protein PENTCL1PPCAC_10240, partial [Pristionchus entomophagus]
NGRHLAVKRFNQAFQTSKRAQRCFRELQLLKALDHENIVKMKFLHTTSCRALCNKYFHSYLTTEYCGENLLYILLHETKDNHFTLISIKKMVSELLRAIKYLNSAKVIHRDLKPDNLAINGQGNLTLLDFGMARVIHENLQHTNEPGTAYFRAIETIEFNVSERINGRRETASLIDANDFLAEMWSMGAILCEMLTGQILFKIDNDNDNDNQKDGETVQRAIEICGPIPDCVLLRVRNSVAKSNINNKDAQERFRKKNANARRIDFLDKFRAEARPWLKEGIEINRVNLKDFIDHTLAFDPDER